MAETKPEIEFNGDEAVFPAKTARGALNEALFDLMVEACPDGRQGEYPDDDELDSIAPRLKGLVMREIREQQLVPCNHAFNELDNLGHDIASGLPEAERNALIERMKPGAGG